MPVSRDSDGNIVDQPTQRVGGSANSDKPTDVAGGRSDYRPGQASPAGDYDAKTVLAGSVRREAQQEADAAASAASGNDARTRIYRPGQTTAAPSAAATGEAAAPAAAAAQSSAMDDPPVGWLVVVDGPGQGNVLTLGNGVNSIGRDTSERLRLDFGDEMISRAGHATVTYDPRGKRFYIQHGGGTNLTYVNDQPVLAPQELASYTHILIGNTMLRFVPLCGEQFDWDQQD